ncbi:MAG: transposase, partial [Clostridia bacterium]|nr:transposase [Clostridia bacterium]
MNDMNSLAHTSWNCKYHIVFAPKYRRKVEIGKILRMLCEWKKVEIV